MEEQGERSPGTDEEYVDMSVLAQESVVSYILVSSDVGCYAELSGGEQACIISYETEMIGKMAISMLNAMDN